MISNRTNQSDKGGVSIMLRKTLQFSTKPIQPENGNTIIGIKVFGLQTLPLHMFAVYMPPVNYYMDSYMEYIDLMQGLVDRYSPEGSIIFCGEFNSDVTNIHMLRNDIRASAFQLFLQRNNLCDISTLGSPKYTFRPTKKTLDYVVTGRWQTGLVYEHSILDNDCCVVSDHLPLLTKVRIPVVNHIQKEQHSPYRTAKCTSIMDPKWTRKRQNQYLL